MTLAAYIAQCSRRVFGWGIWDCCLFASDAVKCMTGKDPASRLRAIYANEKEARQLVEHLGGYAEIVKKAGLKPVTAPFRDGDIGVLSPQSHISALVVYWQGRFLGVDRARGLAPIASRHIQEVFRV